jgi:Protein of unknown function (DUF2934)
MPHSNSHGPISSTRKGPPWAFRIVRAEDPTTSPTHEDIAVRAYEKFLSRGSVHGLDHDDWDEATRELAAELKLSS